MYLDARQRALEYAYNPFYRTLGMKLGMTPQAVIKRSRRRSEAILKLVGRQSKTYNHIGGMRLDNPFIESHAWKFLVREALRNVCQSKKSRS